MSDESKPLMPGDRWQPTAMAVNDFQDAADYVRALKSGGGPAPDPGFDRQQVIATIKNRSGRDCNRFDVLGIDDPIFFPKDDPEAFTSRVGIQCVLPKVADHTTRFVVLLEPVPKIEDDPEHPERQEATLVKACLAGVVPVRLDVVFEWHQFAHIVDDDPTRLVSDCVGYPILWKDKAENKDQDGNRWALVKIGGKASGLGVWQNGGYQAVGPHEHFRITGVGADADHPTAIVGMQPNRHFGPDYGVNGSRQVLPGGYGVCQRSDVLCVAFADSASPEPGEHLGPVPNSGAVARHYPPTCRTLGIVDPANRIAVAESCRPMQRFKLLEPLTECDKAQAQIMGRFGYTYMTLDDYAPDTVSDTFHAVAQSLLAVRNTNTGRLLIPANKCLNARYARGPGDFWEAIEFAECACDGSNSSSSSSSSSSSHHSSSSSSKEPSSSSSSESSDSASSQNSSSMGSFLCSSVSSSPSSSVGSSSPSLEASSGSSSRTSTSSGQSGSPSQSTVPSHSQDKSQTPSDAPSVSPPSYGSQPASDSGSQSGSPLESRKSDGSQPLPSSQSDSGSPPASGSLSPSGSRGSAGSDIDVVPSRSGTGSPSSTSQPSNSGSDKSTAIVPASWSPTGYTALFIAEAPEVRFDDVMVAVVLRINNDLPIDPKFLEVCEPGSVQVCGCVPDRPVLVGAVVEGASVRLRFAEEDATESVQVVLRLTGIRKGFYGHRFPDRTQTQFEANERFIRSAYASE